MKRTISVILAVIMLLGALVVSANAVEDNAQTTLTPREKPTSAEGLTEVFADGEKFFPEVYYGGEVFYAKYTPEQSGAVVIWSYGSMETFRMIYDKNMKLLKENSDLLQTNVVNSDGHLGLLYWVEAGKTYIIGVGMYEAALTPEPITVWMDFYNKYTTDPALLPPQQTITNAHKLPEIFADGKWQGTEVYHGGNAYYRFTSEQSGTIIIWSSGPMETFRLIYDENMNLLELNSDLYSDVIRDAAGRTASTFDVEAGKTYILGFGMYEVTGKMSFCIEFAEQPTDTTEPTTEATAPTTEVTEPTTSAPEPTEPTTESKTTAKKDNKMKVTINEKTVKAKKLKRAKVMVKAIIVKNNNGKVTFSKDAKKSSNRLSINAKTGKITVKKSTKKGNYNIKVKIYAKGNKNYKPKTVTKTAKIKVIK